MKVQTESTIPQVRRYGCYFYTLARMAEEVSGKEFDDPKLERAYKYRSVFRMDENCYMNDPEAAVNFLAALLGSNKTIRQIGINRAGVTTFWPYYEKNGIKDYQFTALKFRTRAGHHFKLGDKDGNVIFDPDPTVKCFDLVSTIFYRVRG